VIFYTVVKNHVEYDESIWATRDAHREEAQAASPTVGLPTHSHRTQGCITIGIGGTVARPPLPHHRTCGSAYGGSAG
jgi:hypothetical protein